MFSRPYPPCPADAFVSGAKAALRLSGLSSLVTVGLVRVGTETVEVAGVRSEVERGVGHASRAMRAVLDIADRHGVRLTLTPCAFAYPEHGETEAETERMASLDAASLSDLSLREWYLRLGFVDVEPQVMERRPARPSSWSSRVVGIPDHVPRS